MYHDGQDWMAMSAENRQASIVNSRAHIASETRKLARKLAAHAAALLAEEAPDAELIMFTVAEGDDGAEEAVIFDARDAQGRQVTVAGGDFAPGIAAAQRLLSEATALGAQFQSTGAAQCHRIVLAAPLADITFRGE